MKDLTIVMPFLNEGNEPQRTIDSIYDTAHPNRFDIIAIDDCSKEKSEIESRNSVRLIRMKNRIGVDGCRQIGVEEAKTPYVLIIDGHMRFPNRWMEHILSFLEHHPKSICCTTCLLLGYGNMELKLANIRYYGATLKIVDSSASMDRPAREILEPKWIEKSSGNSYEIPCVLGANYFFSKKWFDHLHGLKGLRMWGSSEPFLSMKSFMAGGDSQILTTIDIGHKFRRAAPYSTGVDNMIYNKIYMMETILPNELCEKLMTFMPKTKSHQKAVKSIRNNYSEIMADKKYYDSIFTRNIYDYCSRYEIELPS